MNCSQTLIRLPSLELARFKEINFFPPKPKDLSALTELCIGSKSRSLGDTLMVTTLPRRLRTQYPHLKISTYTRAFNPVVFLNNHHVSAVRWLPDALYGDDCNWGEGHLIQLKEIFFDLERSSNPKPELYLSPSETLWAQRFLNSTQRPVIVIHPWGKTFSSVLDSEFWSNVITRWKNKFDFIQVGMKGQTLIAGTTDALMLSRPRHHARHLFALIAEATGFLGVNSGPMHVARAFEIPGLIFTEGESPETVFENRKKFPYFQKRNWFHGFLYEANQHLCCTDLKTPQAHQGVDAFLDGIQNSV